MCNFPTRVLTYDESLGIEPTGALSQEGWRSIETAPRDGTPVLGYDGGHLIVWWAEDNSGWDDSLWGCRPTPTHWQPLPPPPLT